MCGFKGHRTSSVEQPLNYYLGYVSKHSATFHAKRYSLKWFLEPRTETGLNQLSTTHERKCGRIAA